jgi:hypothetical protein
MDNVVTVEVSGDSSKPRCFCDGMQYTSNLEFNKCKMRTFYELKICAPYGG